MSLAPDRGIDLVLTVPGRLLSPIVEELIRGLVKESGSERADVGFVAVESRADCPENECMPSVARLVLVEGGAMITGWRIWEAAGYAACAEHHAIWVKPDGTIVDPNLYDDAPPEIFFVNDPTATWAGTGHLARKTSWFVHETAPGFRVVIENRMREEALHEARYYADRGEEIPYRRSE